MLVNEFLENSADKYPDKEALIFEGRRLTYSQLEDSANRLANVFLDKGLQKQDRVAVFLENSPEAVISIFAALKAGGVFLVINPMVKPQKIKYILNDSQAKILITDSKRFEEILSILPNCPDLEIVLIADNGGKEKEDFTNIDKKIISYSSVLNNYPSHRPAKMCIDIDLASLIYTSGSTGEPKGVMLTHLNMVSAANSIIEYLENSEKDIVINVFPLSFDYGLYQVLMTFKFGGTLVLERSFFYPYKLIDLIIKEKVTGFPIVPTIAAILVKLKNLDKYDFSSLRYISTTAQAMPPRFIFELRKIFPKAKFYSMYGLTECKRVSYLPPEELDRRPTSVGKAMPNTEVYLVDEEGNKIDEPGKIGELVVRGANVMKGYWNLPQETERVLKPGQLPGEKVLYTGDLFKMDERGFLYFISRKDDIIKIAGANVAPKEIENAIYEIEDVAEVAVTSVEDEILGNAIKAFIVLKDGSNLTEKDIILLCSQRIEKFMVPKYIEIRKELPKTAHGKISKRDLA